MTTKWRFDQGRGKYHAFDNVVKIAKAMVSLDGKNPRDTPCPIKGYFSSIDLDFPPDDPSYPAWRNYARTFSLLMLVPTGRDISVIEPTDLCREIAKGTKGKVGNFDEYLFHLIGHWIYPNPAFEDYSNSHPKVFPLLAILKLLTSKLELGLPPRLSVDEIFELLIFNNVSGNENSSFYKTLKTKAGSFSDDEKRQVRELLKFISQGTYFNWSDDSIHLTISLSEASNLEKSIPLYLNKPSASRKDQLVTVSKLISSPISFTPIFKERLIGGIICCSSRNSRRERICRRK